MSNLCACISLHMSIIYSIVDRAVTSRTSVSDEKKKTKRCPLDFYCLFYYVRYNVAWVCNLIKTLCQLYDKHVLDLHAKLGNSWDTLTIYQFKYRALFYLLIVASFSNIILQSVVHSMTSSCNLNSLFKKRLTNRNFLDRCIYLYPCSIWGTIKTNIATKYHYAFMFALRLTYCCIFTVVIYFLW